MCSTSDTDKMLAAMSGSAGAGSAPAGGAKQVPPGCVRAQRDSYYLIDVRDEADEAEEAKADLGDLAADARFTLGMLLRTAAEGKLDHLRSSGKQIVTVCNIGYRAGIAARELAAKGFDAATLERGMMAYKNPAATRPDFVVLLASSSHAEKVTIGLTAAAVKAGQGKQVVVIALTDGVELFRNPGVRCRPGASDDEDARALRIADINIGAPYQPAAAQLDKFLAAGGIVLGCKSCCVHRGLKYNETLHPSVHPMQMPDLLRMLDEATSSLQFT